MPLRFFADVHFGCHRFFFETIRLPPPSQFLCMCSVQTSRISTKQTLGCFFFLFWESSCEELRCLWKWSWFSFAQKCVGFHLNPMEKWTFPTWMKLVAMENVNWQQSYFRDRNIPDRKMPNIWWRLVYKLSICICAAWQMLGAFGLTTHTHTRRKKKCRYSK